MIQLWSHHLGGKLLLSALEYEINTERLETVSYHTCFTYNELFILGLFWIYGTSCEDIESTLFLLV